MATAQEFSIFWFRRDLRFEDNHALFRALESGRPVLPVFLFDSGILNNLPRTDARVRFIYVRIEQLKNELRERGSDLIVGVGKPKDVWREWLELKGLRAIYCNEDYEPSAIARDHEIFELAAKKKIEFHAFKDQVIFAKDEVAKDNGEPYKVFTPYSRKWKSLLKLEHLKAFPSERLMGNLLPRAKREALPKIADLGFDSGPAPKAPAQVSRENLKAYGKRRDLLALDATSHLGLPLRFGTVSVRKLAKLARETSEIFLNELIWREFFMQILFHFPRTENAPFDERYADIAWRNSKADFKRWCEGSTGYPLVDAGMRELNATGFMHNRARMVTASFLTKHLLIDWRWGERYFAEKLLDFELASNVGNWQWVAGCGCDAAPYFRVFNPALQLKKFDPDGKYVQRWVAEHNTSEYPEPMIDHTLAQRRAIVEFRKALTKGARK